MVIVQNKWHTKKGKYFFSTQFFLSAAAKKGYCEKNEVTAVHVIENACTI